jgi:HPt (histidine-containing phosphotransfer) domain-containing protein
MVTQAAFDRAMAEIYAKIEELRTYTADRFAQDKDLLEHRLKAEAKVARVQAEKDRAELLQGVYRQLKVTQDINIASQLDLHGQLANLIARLDKAGQFLLVLVF